MYINVKCYLAYLDQPQQSREIIETRLNYTDLKNKSTDLLHGIVARIGTKICRTTRQSTGYHIPPFEVVEVHIRSQDILVLL